MQRNGPTTYSVVFAERRKIGNEWNLIKWDRTLKDIQYHRLYFLTEGRATLKMSSGDVELVPGRVYFVPAFSVLESKIEGEMDKYYIHFTTDDSMLDMFRYISNKTSVSASAFSEELFLFINSTNSCVLARA